MSFNAVDYYRANSKKLITKTARANIYLASFLWYTPGLNYPSQAVIKEIFSFTQNQLKEAEIQLTAWKIHPNIIKIYFWEPTENDTLSIYLEYCEKGLDNELTQRNQNCDWFTGELLLKHFKNLTHILKSLHENNITHRDIKPHNIRYDEFGNLKLADFGESKILAGNEESEFHSLVGTVPYFSPEAQYKLTNKESRISTSPLKDDVYQLGRTFFDMLICRLDPYDNQLSYEDRLSIMVEVCNERNYPKNFIDIILKMTEPNFHNRISAKTAYDLLSNIIISNEIIPFEMQDEIALGTYEEDKSEPNNIPGSVISKENNVDSEIKSSNFPDMNISKDNVDSEEAQAEPAYDYISNRYQSNKVEETSEAQEIIKKNEESNLPNVYSTPKFDKKLYLASDYESVSFRSDELFVKNELKNKNSISTAASNEIENLKEEELRRLSLGIPSNPEHITRPPNSHANSANFEGWNKHSSNSNFLSDKTKKLANNEKLNYDQTKTPKSKANSMACDICKLMTKTETIITTPCGHNYHHLCFNEKIGNSIKHSDKLCNIRCQICHCSLTYKFLESNITEIFYPDIAKRLCLLNFSEVSIDCPFCKTPTKNKLINEKLKNKTVRCPKCRGNFCSFCSYTGGHRKCKELLKVLESKSLF
ncbi:unnamed protein product [Blepharisma stoltei]|uniref:Protein kinase domain-containing protein n=1 Tax=Blepharisma stoltei TaxID=1481888 RepID=A0AAU9JE03_9CILI|nr:unnamed protein product [Blepharisma stoltei]